MIEEVQQRLATVRGPAGENETNGSTDSSVPEMSGLGPAQPPVIPGYEMFGELGGGGMGVV